MVLPCYFASEGKAERSSAIRDCAGIFILLCLIAAALLSREVESAEGADSLRESLGWFLRAKPNAGFQLKAAFMGNMERDSCLGWKLL